jgi:AcrR family transcriptional regulator
MAMGKLVPKDLRILRAAEEVFSRKGYHNSTLDEIVKIADTGKGTVYKYYKNKEMLFYTLISQKNDQFMKELNQIYKSSTAFSDRFMGYFRTMVEFMDENKVLWSVLFFEILGVSGGWQLHWNAEKKKYDVTISWGDAPTQKDIETKTRYADIIRGEIEILIDILNGGEKEGFLRPNPDVAVMAQNMYFSLMGMIMQGCLSKDKREEVLSSFLDRFLYGHVLRKGKEE